jgi:2-oxoisovalerate dehydrogenase E1 component
MPTGAGVAAGPFHSQSNEAWFSHIPGLKIAYPSNAYDAKGLLLTAFEDPNPVMVFEHKALYRSTTEQVPTGYYNLPFGQANLVKEGTDMSIITYGMGVHWAIKLVEKEGLNIDVLDLRTLVPLDWESVFKSAKKTGKVIVLHEDTLFGGIGGELVAEISDQCFEYLDAPVKRVASIDTAVPFHPNLESNFLPIQRLEKAVKEMLSY